MDETSYGSDNINTLWLKNVYENIKLLEEHSRLAREGCTSLMDYLQIPHQQRDIIIGDTQYKNLRFMVTEFSLLLEDLEIPIKNKEKLKKFRKAIREIEEKLEHRHLFIKEARDVKNGVRSSKTTPFFTQTLIFLSDLKIDIFRNIAHLIYPEDNQAIGWNRTNPSTQ